MEEVLQHLRSARLHASTGEESKAKRHLDEAEELLENAGRLPSSRAVRGHITDARLFIKNGHAARAVTAIESALEALDDQKPAGKP